MQATNSTNSFSLAKATTKRIPDPAGLEITCTRGTIWITLENILHDVILTAGTSEDTFVTRSHRSALIYALSDARFVIAAPAETTTHTQHSAAPWQCNQPMPPMFHE